MKAQPFSGALGFRPNGGRGGIRRIRGRDLYSPEMNAAVTNQTLRAAAEAVSGSEVALVRPSASADRTHD